MSDLNSLIHDLCNCNVNTNISANVACMTNILTNFLSMTPKDGADGSEEYLQIFVHSSIPVALVKLYVSPSVTKKQATHGYICQFIDKLGVDDAFYIFFQSSLTAMMKRYVHSNVRDFIKFMHPVKCAI
ncbi:hypothetical protein H5410_045162 [Solanum commersonii]|uniref:Uncharacterized protein n=1 Tax=Solanum commersonii TaxID=4109 RepID=A0A9J5XCW9_SOLCO|nr:hypothetical protein H5410_045162 [Solanum commersonii]